MTSALTPAQRQKWARLLLKTSLHLTKTPQTRELVRMWQLTEYEPRKARA